MVEPLTDMPDRVIGFRAVGDIETDDYRDVLVPAVDKARREHGKVRFVYVLGADFDEYEPGALFEDTKLGFEHPLSWERIAVVTNARWAQPAMRVFSFLWPGKARAFPLGELEAAKDWAAADD